MEEYTKYGEYIEYPGESFSQSLAKSDESEWSVSSAGNWKLVDNTGSVVISGSCTFDAERFDMIFTIGKSNTVGLFGIYKLLVYVTDTVDSEINYVIVDYKMDYRKIIARND